MNFVNAIITGDCREILKDVPADSVSACITDPPYNYEFIGRHWNVDEIARRCKRIQASNTLVKNIPYGSGLAGGCEMEIGIGETVRISWSTKSGVSSGPLRFTAC
jgi:site-specific DNA-methyltransferase (adenine-specific)